MGTQWFHGFRTRAQLAGRLPGAVLAAVLVMSTLLVTGAAAAPASAAPLAVEPGDIALNLDDLRPGFSPDPRFMREGQLENVGPLTQVQYEREVNALTVRDGPVVVGQVIIRLDTGIGAGDALIVVRDSLLNQNGQSISDAGPNDGGTFTLFKKDGPLEIYSVGFIKENMVIVTLTGGLEGVVSPAGTLELAGISSARLDAALGR
jgi:hypothetical protein